MHAVCTKGFALKCFHFCQDKFFFKCNITYTLLTTSGAYQQSVLYVYNWSLICYSDAIGVLDSSNQDGGDDQG